MDQLNVTYSASSLPSTTYTAEMSYLFGPRYFQGQSNARQWLQVSAT